MVSLPNANLRKFHKTICQHIFTLVAVLSRTTTRLDESIFITLATNPLQTFDLNFSLKLGINSWLFTVVNYEEKSFMG